jgi:hypothetical protein
MACTSALVALPFAWAKAWGAASARVAATAVASTEFLTV